MMVPNFNTEVRRDGPELRARLPLQDLRREQTHLQ
jgi:hypothetical protein